MTTSSRAVPTDRTPVLVRRTITFVVFVIAGLAFAFGFGNGWTLGLELGVPRWIAPLVSPAVDLSVVALIVSIQYIRAQGLISHLFGPRLLLVFSGVTTLVINTARAVLEQHLGRAAFDAVAPLLLIFWGEVGPGLLALLHSSDSANQIEHADRINVVRDGAPSVPDEIGPSSQLVAVARQLDSQHREAVGRPITRDKLRAQLKVSNAVAGELVRIVRTAPNGGEPP